MSYFDNVNKNVTRKSFGSRIDKEFKREGVIPVTKRNKKEEDELLESSKKYTELNKKVNERQMNDIRNRSMYDNAMREGYNKIKEYLVKDFLSYICLESLLVDDDVVNDNIEYITSIVEEHVEKLGGYEGIKKIADSTNNIVLQKMLSICETTAKNVSKRNIVEAKGCGDKVNFCLNKIELEEYECKKGEMGVDAIVNNIKDKVFQVVKDEQETNNDKQMVMKDIEEKVSELEAPEETVEEAMKFIFEDAIEESTLFNSMMRSHYKQLLETNSSPIFESLDFKEEEVLFEDGEFDMEDVNMDDINEEDKDEIEDMFLKECRILNDIEDDEEFDSMLENYYNLLEEGSLNIQSYYQAKHYKNILRKSQDELEYLEEKFVKNIQKYSRKISDKKLDKTIAKWEQDIEKIRDRIEREEDPDYLNDYREDLKTLTAELKALKAEKSHRGKQLKIAKEANPYMKSTMEGNSLTEIRNKLKYRVTETKDEELSGEVHEVEKDDKSVSEEVILCPKCGKEECTCKVAKESVEYNLLSNTINKIENLCENMDVIIEAHENARTNVVNSLTREVNDELTLVPYLQTKDVNLNNLEFIYKTKIVCESLKNNLKSIKTKQEARTLKRAVELNVTSINETLDIIKEREDMKYKSNILNSGKVYLNKINTVLVEEWDYFDEEIIESNSPFDKPEDVDLIFNQVREYYVIESTDTDLMELVMAEAIVEYTILETFNTLKLINFTKDSVRQMARKNLNK